MHSACSLTGNKRKIYRKMCTHLMSCQQYFVCILYRWEDCKQLLLTPKFFESLKFFDRDNVPLRKLRRLEKMINRSAKFEYLDQGSQAIVPVCTWLTALVDYHYAKMAVQPYRDRLRKAETTLMDVSWCYCTSRPRAEPCTITLENFVGFKKFWACEHANGYMC